MSWLGHLLGLDSDDPAKDKDYHEEHHGWGWPQRSNDNKSADFGSASTHDGWWSLDPDQPEGGWFRTVTTRPLGWLGGRMYHRPTTPRRWTWLLYFSAVMTVVSWMGWRITP